MVGSPRELGLKLVGSVTKEVVDMASSVLTKSNWAKVLPMLLLNVSTRTRGSILSHNEVRVPKPSQIVQIMEDPTKENA